MEAIFFERRSRLTYKNVNPNLGIMTILLSRILIKNFRSCKDTEVILSSFTPLVGYNNCGKSNILSAIQWLLRKSSLEKSDFNDSEAEIEVSGLIEGISEAVLELLDAKQRGSIAPYIKSGALRIKRTQQKPNARASEINLFVGAVDDDQWVPNPNGIDNALAALLPEPIRIGAMENAAEDASKAKTTTTIGKLLAEFLHPVRAAHGAELGVHLKEVEKRIAAEGDSRFDELGVIDQSINEKIEDLFPGIHVKLDFPVPTLDELIKGGTIKVYEGGNEGRAFTSYGHGAQRSIQIALIRYLAEVKKANGAKAGTTLLLIDEPELYLHPFAVEQIRSALKSLSRTGYQVIFSTHSGQLVSSMDAQNTLLIRKDAEKGTYARKRLLESIQSIVPNSIHQMEQLFTLTNSSRVLFSEKVLLTEGKTEIRLLPCIFEKITGKSLGQAKIAIVGQSGVNDTKKSIEILGAMDLPTRAIVDLDYAFNGAVTHGFLSKTDTDLNTLKNILEQMKNSGKITLNPSTGLPMKGITTAAEAFTLLALETDAKTAITNIHERLKKIGIWMWTLGAIEQHIGTTTKDESSWAAFQTKIEAGELAAICPDMIGLSALIAWILQ